jgi:RHS repeat-associated protein
VGRLVQVVDATGTNVTASHLYAWCGTARCLEFDASQTLPPSAGAPARNRAAPDKLYLSQGMIEYTSSEFQYNPEAIIGLPRQASVTRTYYVADALGSVRQLVGQGPSGSLSILSQYDYSPFGVQSRTGGPSGGLESDFGFAGYFRDATAGLNFTRNRVYDGQLGRWLTRDPLGNTVAFGPQPKFDASGLNFYAYVDNDPTSSVDPLGLNGWALGFNAGYVAGAGVGSGGYVEVGVYWNRDTGTLDLYASTAHADDGPGVGVAASYGATVTYVPNSDDFYGPGYEASLEPPKLPWGPNYQNEYDENLQWVGSAGGVSGGFGGGVFTYQTDTYPLYNIWTRDGCPTGGGADQP